MISFKEFLGENVQHIPSVLALYKDTKSLKLNDDGFGKLSDLIVLHKRSAGSSEQLRAKVKHTFGLTDDKTLKKFMKKHINEQYELDEAKVPFKVCRNCWTNYAPSKYKCPKCKSSMYDAPTDAKIKANKEEKKKNADTLKKLIGEGLDPKYKEFGRAAFDSMKQMLAVGKLEVFRRFIMSDKKVYVRRQHQNHDGLGPNDWVMANEDQKYALSVAMSKNGLIFGYILYKIEGNEWKIVKQYSVDDKKSKK